ncbi:hypothetical protein N9Y17_01760 [Gammaproteobacteria bacterium]|nr:hypothetical protein [Gammaproteobacteria bacterium]
MKRLLSSLVLSLFAAAFAENKEDNFHSRYNIQMNVLPSIVGVFSGEGNVRLNDTDSLGIYGGRWLVKYTSKDDTYFYLGLRHAHMLKHDQDSDGWLLKSFFGMGQVRYESDGVPIKATTLETGCLLNYQWFFKKEHLFIQAGVGPQIFVVMMRSPEYIPTDDGDFVRHPSPVAVNLWGQIMIGYAF